MRLGDRHGLRATHLAQVHTGHVKLKTAAPKTPLLVSLRICPSQSEYASTERNGLKSREWNGVHKGLSYKVERCLQVIYWPQPSGQSPRAHICKASQSHHP